MTPGVVPWMSVIAAKLIRLIYGVFCYRERVYKKGFLGKRKPPGNVKRRQAIAAGRRFGSIKIHRQVRGTGLPYPGSLFHTAPSHTDTVTQPLRGFERYLATHQGHSGIRHISHPASLHPSHCPFPYTEPLLPDPSYSIYRTRGHNRMSRTGYGQDSDQSHIVS